MPGELPVVSSDLSALEKAGSDAPMGIVRFAGSNPNRGIAIHAGKYGVPLLVRTEKPLVLIGEWDVTAMAISKVVPHGFWNVAVNFE